MDNPSTYLPDLLKALPEITADTILSRSLHKDEKTDVTLFGFAAGQELTEHTSPYGAIIQVLEGQANISLGKDTVSAEAGLCRGSGWRQRWITRSTAGSSSFTSVVMLSGAARSCMCISSISEAAWNARFPVNSS